MKHNYEVDFTFRVFDVNTSQDLDSDSYEKFKTWEEVEEFVQFLHQIQEIKMHELETVEVPDCIMDNGNAIFTADDWLMIHDPVALFVVSVGRVWEVERKEHLSDEKERVDRSE